ncbi:hypothetical protein KC946_00620 [Candidatus Saccharibacteria bacterium]|nr:hypothetical protein [Candidatus Saccharibacteria bacterium]
MFSKIIKTIVGSNQRERQQELYSNLIRHEAKIGGTLFGPVQPGGKREFFCLDEKTWVWHEEWIDQNKQHQTKTTRYNVRPNSILKAVDGGHYQLVSDYEAKHLREAARLYEKKIKTQLYDRI